MPFRRYFLVLAILCCLTLNTARGAEGNAGAGGGNETPKCGLSSAKSTSNASNLRIMRAQEAEKGAWPWVVEIYSNRTGNKREATCGGALISRSFVVTAANCLVSRGETLDAKKLSVRLGDHDLESDKDGKKPVDSNVTSLQVHEEFDPISFRNDIALLRLQHPVNFSQDIQPICLPDDSMRHEDLESRTGYVAGWGTTSSGGSQSNVPMEMSAAITSDESCREAYDGMATITDNNLCTFGVNGSSPCQGFGGSPLMLPNKDKRFYLAGIVSFGAGCGNPSYPDVYTRGSTFSDWITQHMS